MSTIDCEHIQALLKDIFTGLNDLTGILKQLDPVIRAAEGKPLAECGASDKIKIAVAVLAYHGVSIPVVPESPAAASAALAKRS